MALIVGALHFLAQQVGQVANNRTFIPAMLLACNQHLTGRTRGGQAVVAKYLHVIEALRRHFVGARGVGADGGDQRRFAQA
ncbi:hypothetical protein D3C80_1972070 [compost metagenome]